VKIAVNTRPVDGPWGGGNRFVRALEQAARSRGHEVVNDLAPDVDLALMIDPRARNPQLTFTPGRLQQHLRSHPRTIVVHRINECDERKGTHTINWRLRLANHVADHTVFIASWLKELAVWRRTTPFSVILNGADEAIFRRDSARLWDGREPLRIVTHHWGGHVKKGWDVYGRLDALMGEPRWRGRLAFTSIGNAPAGIATRHVEMIRPLDGDALAAALAAGHVYITASVNEPAGMHHVEGALIGLPLLFRRSGALPEYCTGYGEAFDGPDDFEPALARMAERYSDWKTAVGRYPNTAARMTAQYLDLFERLDAERDAILTARETRRDWLASALVQVPL
jgi:hypothetical protein